MAISTPPELVELALSVSFSSGTVATMAVADDVLLLKIEADVTVGSVDIKAEVISVCVTVGVVMYFVISA